MLGLLTALVYPSLQDIIYHAARSKLETTHLLANLCLKKLFIGIWLAAIGSVLASVIISQYNLRYLKKFSRDLAATNLDQLNGALKPNDYPKELDLLTETCNQMFAKLDNKFKELKEFSTILAHELRNPIHCLQTSTEVSLSKTLSLEEHSALLMTNLEEYKSLSSLIDNLLFLARCDQKLIPLSYESIASIALMADLVSYYQYLADEKKMTLRLEGNEDLKVDKTLFKRVLANLLDNAIKYAPPGSTVLIKTELEAEHVLISVSDSGSGFKEGEKKGLGLGLKIVRSIIDAHQGELNIKSNKHGNTILLRLPK
jgi:two-component system heavy metal sensor histidine kinase CusS